jgi:hypothetical protein
VREALSDEGQGCGIACEESLERRRAVPAGQQRGQGLLEEGWKDRKEGREKRGWGVVRCETE